LNIALMLGAVWGNQADLGYRITAGDAGPGGRHVIRDDRAETLAWLQERPAARITIIADNGGSEIAADLILTDHLLRAGIATDIALHVKPYPYFVSDATTADVLACLRQLGAGPAPAVADRLRRALNEGRLTIQTHPFYCHPWSFHYLPGDLARRLASANLVIAKGDLNYRRLVGDFEWPPTDSFHDATAYFPAPVLSLRILKSDVIIGLPADRVAELDRSDPSWRTNSNYAVAQAALAARAN
jgi:damage control phosphatase ARMT1-like protein